MDQPQLQQMPEAGQRAAGGGAAQRARGDAMLERAERMLSPVIAAVLATEQGRNLLLAEAASDHLAVFGVSIGCFYLLALFRRAMFTVFVPADLLDDCSAFLRVQMLMSILGIFLHDKVPWITYMPLVFLVFLLARALLRICKPRQHNMEDVAREMSE